MSDITFIAQPIHKRFKAVVHEHVIIDDYHEVYLEAPDESSARFLLSQRMDRIPSNFETRSLNQSTVRLIESFKEVIDV